MAVKIDNVIVWLMICVCYMVLAYRSTGCCYLTQLIHTFLLHYLICLYVVI